MDPIDYFSNMIDPFLCSYICFNDYVPLELDVFVNIQNKYIEHLLLSYFVDRSSIFWRESFKVDSGNNAF